MTAVSSQNEAPGTLDTPEKVTRTPSIASNPQGGPLALGPAAAGCSTPMFGTWPLPPTPLPNFAAPGTPAMLSGAMGMPMPGQLVQAPSRGHYDVLGISRKASLASLRRAFRRRVLQTHPDKGGDPEDFILAMKSFEVLSDRRLRDEYDLDLNRRGCQDGNRAAPGTPGSEWESVDTQKTVKGMARSTHWVLLNEDSSCWFQCLSEASSAVLQALVDIIREQLQTSRGSLRGKNAGAKAASFPASHGTEKTPQAAASEPRRRPPVQRHIYAAPLADGTSRYWVQQSWDAFRVTTGRTASLTQAVDWHIALSAAKEVAKARMASSAAGDGPMPLSPQELIQILQTAPDIQLSFSAKFCNKKKRLMNVTTPACGDLEVALALYRRYLAFVESPDEVSKQFLGAERTKARVEVERKTAALAEANRKLLEEVLGELRSRLEGCNAGSGESTANLSETPSQQILKHADITPRPAGVKRKPAAKESSHPTKVRRISPAVELQIALRLDDEAMPSVIRALRRLTVQEVQSRVAALTAPPPLLALPDSGWPAPKRTGIAGGVLVRRTPLLDHGGSRLALAQCSTRKACHRQGASSSSATRRTPNRGHASTMLSFLPPQAASTTESSIPGLPFGVGILLWLVFQDVAHFRAASRSAAGAAGREVASRFNHFSYEAAFFEPRAPRRTRSGRLVVTTSGACGSEAAQCLISCLTNLHHSLLFTSLDLRRAPALALERRDLQSSLQAMRNLCKVTLPWHGWSTVSERTRFLKSLSAGVAYECVDLAGAVCLHGVTQVARVVEGSS